MSGFEVDPKHQETDHTADQEDNIEIPVYSQIVNFRQKIFHIFFVLFRQVVLHQEKCRQEIDLT